MRMARLPEGEIRQSVELRISSKGSPKPVGRRPILRSPWNWRLVAELPFPELTLDPISRRSAQPASMANVLSGLCVPAKPASLKDVASWRWGCLVAKKEIVRLADATVTLADWDVIDD
jgi:hypothetical protein